MLQKKTILLIGYDSNLCLGVVYCLKSLGYDFFLLTWNKTTAAKYSRFIKKVFYYVNYDGLDTQVIDIVKSCKIDIIMPFDELEIRWVKENNQLLSEHAACTWGTEPGFFDIGINKMSLAGLLKENNLPCPDFGTVNNFEQLENEATRLGFPLLIKPTRGNYGRGIKKLDDWAALKSFYEKAKNFEKEYIMQPFIIGSDITCNVICKNGKILCHTIQESPVKYGTNFRSNDILSFHEDEQVITAVSKMMTLLDWNGVACVDMRRSYEDQSIMILEINGRFWASVVTSFLKAGVNFPEIMAKLALGEKVLFPKQQSAIPRSLSGSIYATCLPAKKPRSGKLNISVTLPTLLRGLNK